MFGACTRYISRRGIIRLCLPQPVYSQTIGQCALRSDTLSKVWTLNCQVKILILHGIINLQMLFKNCQFINYFTFQMVILFFHGMPAEFQILELRSQGRVSELRAHYTTQFTHNRHSERSHFSQNTTGLRNDLK